MTFTAWFEFARWLRSVWSDEFRGDDVGVVLGIPTRADESGRMVVISDGRFTADEAFIGWRGRDETLSVEVLFVASAAVDDHDEVAAEVEQLAARAWQALAGAAAPVCDVDIAQGDVIFTTTENRRLVLVRASIEARNYRR